MHEGEGWKLGLKALAVEVLKRFSFTFLLRYIMGVTCIFILVFFKFFDQVWKPWRYVRSFGPLFVCIVGLSAVYIGQVRLRLCMNCAVPRLPEHTSIGHRIYLPHPQVNTLGIPPPASEPCMQPLTSRAPGGRSRSNCLFRVRALTADPSLALTAPVQVDTLDRGSLATVGAIPAGLPPFTGGLWAFQAKVGDCSLAPSFTELFPTTVVVMFIDLLESTSIAR